MNWKTIGLLGVGVFGLYLISRRRAEIVQLSNGQIGAVTPFSDAALRATLEAKNWALDGFAHVPEYIPPDP